MARIDYRTSHASGDAAAEYRRTYSQGYYAAQWQRLERPLIEKLFQELSNQGSRRMLDLACGQGRITLLGAKYFDEVVGLDYSEAMLAIAREQLEADPALANANLNFIQGDIGNFTLPEPADVITAFRFFLNAEDSLRRDGLRCIRRNLAPQGTLIASVQVSGSSPLAMIFGVTNAFWRVAGGTPNRVRNSLSLSAFRRLLDEEGFEINQVSRYSLLPRIGSLTHGLAERHIDKFDRAAKAVPGLSVLCQSYVVCARLKEQTP